MPYYKDPLNNIHFLDSDEHEPLLPKGSVQITDTEAAALKPQTIEANPVLIEIYTLEATITPRRMREALITQDMTFINNVESQIAALRATI